MDLDFLFMKSQIHYDGDIRAHFFQYFWIFFSLKTVLVWSYRPVAEYIWLHLPDRITMMDVCLPGFLSIRNSSNPDQIPQRSEEPPPCLPADTHHRTALRPFENKLASAKYF